MCSKLTPQLFICVVKLNLHLWHKISGTTRLTVKYICCFVHKGTLSGGNQCSKLLVWAGLNNFRPSLSIWLISSNSKCSLITTGQPDCRVGWQARNLTETYTRNTFYFSLYSTKHHEVTSNSLKRVLMLLSSCFVITSSSQQKSRHVSENHRDSAKERITPFATSLEIFCNSCAKLGTAFQQLFTLWVEAPTLQFPTTTRALQRSEIVQKMSI